MTIHQAISRSVVALVGVAALSTTAPATAHHAIQAEFDTNKTEEFTGELTRFAMVNPHVRWFFDVKEPDGTISKWELSGAGPGVLRELGMARIFIIGDTYRATFAPARNGSKLGRVRTFTFKDGREVTLYHKDPNNPLNQ